MLPNQLCHALDWSDNEVVVEEDQIDVTRRQKVFFKVIWVLYKIYFVEGDIICKDIFKF